MAESDRAYLAIDLGASSGRGMVGKLAEGRVTLEEIHRFETPVHEQNDHLHWDLETLQAEVNRCLELAVQHEPALRSVSVDSWAVDYVSIDESGNPLGDPFAYRDQRTEGVIEAATRIMPRERLYEITGIQFLPFNTLFQILAGKRDDPAGVKSVYKRLLIADYFNFVFSGVAAIELSMASTTHMVDAQTQQWSDEVLDAFGIQRSQLPPIVPSGTRLGRCAAYAEVQVVAACSHDTAAAVAAVPATGGSNWAYISCGTWSLLGLERQDPILTPEALEAGYTNEIGTGGSIRFLKNLSGLWALQECVREWEVQASISYRELIARARRAREIEGFIDLDDPRFLPPGDMEARLRAYCKENEIEQPADRGELVSLILRSIAEAYARAITALEPIAGLSIDVIHLVGGGSQNTLLCQLAADATGCTVIAGPAEATALGNVLVQAESLGDLTDEVTIRDVVRRSFDAKTYQPR